MNLLSPIPPVGAFKGKGEKWSSSLDWPRNSQFQPVKICRFAKSMEFGKAYIYTRIFRLWNVRSIRSTRPNVSHFCGLKHSSIEAWGSQTKLIAALENQTQHKNNCFLIKAKFKLFFVFFPSNKPEPKSETFGPAVAPVRPSHKFGDSKSIARQSWTAYDSSISSSSGSEIAKGTVGHMWRPNGDFVRNESEESRPLLCSRLDRLLF